LLVVVLALAGTLEILETVVVEQGVYYLLLQI